MELSEISDKALEKCIKKLENAKIHRKGGLMIGEQAALEKFKAELEARRKVAEGG